MTIVSSNVSFARNSHQINRVDYCFFSSTFISVCYFVYFEPNNITIYTRTNNFLQSHRPNNIFISTDCVLCMCVCNSQAVRFCSLFFSQYHNFSTHGIFPFIIKGMKSFHSTNGIRMIVEHQILLWHWFNYEQEKMLYVLFFFVHHHSCTVFFFLLTSHQLQCISANKSFGR